MCKYSLYNVFSWTLYSVLLQPQREVIGSGWGVTYTPDLALPLFFFFLLSKHCSFPASHSEIIFTIFPSSIPDFAFVYNEHMLFVASFLKFINVYVQISSVFLGLLQTPVYPGMVDKKFTIGLGTIQHVIYKCQKQCRSMNTALRDSSLNLLPVWKWPYPDPYFLLESTWSSYSLLQQLQF